MAYKTSFSLLNTEKLNDITVKSGNYSATFTYPYENVEGTIPSSECESDVDMNYSLEFTENNPYDDESLATYMYQFSFSNLPNGGGGINASTWSFEGIQLLSTGYLPLTLTDSNLNDLMFVHPSIQIPNITINGSDYWESHKSQYNEMIGESIDPLVLDLRGYPINNTISIVDPSEEYYYTDNNDNDLVNYTLQKGSSLNVKINKTPEFWEVPREITVQGVYQLPSNNFSVTMPNDVIEIGEYGLAGCFYNCNKLTSFNANNITTIRAYGLNKCFSKCTSLTTAKFNNLTTVGQSGLYEAFLENTSLTNVEFNNLTTVGQNGCWGLFQNCTSLTTAPTFANLTTVGMSGLNRCFYYCTSLTTAPTFANLTTVGGNGMQLCLSGCSNLTTAPTFDNLTTIESTGFWGCFSSCSNITTAPTFANLTTIGSSGLIDCFYGCTNLTTAPTFANLTTIDMYGLQSCFGRTNITSLSFPALKSNSFGSYTNQFYNMLQGVTGCTVHFPSNLQSVIGSWSDVTNGFNGTNTTVLFDLPATS